MRVLADEDLISDPYQPEGRMYFAPRPEDLQMVFTQVAEDLLARLTR